MLAGICALIAGTFLEYLAFTVDDTNLGGACFNFGIILIVAGAFDVWG